jgi:hypothetical protein
VLQPILVERRTGSTDPSRVTGGFRGDGGDHQIAIGEVIAASGEGAARR